MNTEYFTKQLKIQHFLAKFFIVFAGGTILTDIITKIFPTYGSVIVGGLIGFLFIVVGEEQ